MCKLHAEHLEPYFSFMKRNTLFLLLVIGMSIPAFAQNDSIYLNSFYSLKPRLRTIDAANAAAIKQQSDSLASGYYLVNSRGVYLLKSQDDNHWLITISSRPETVDSAFVYVTKESRALLMLYTSYIGGITLSNGFNKESSRALRIIDIDRDWVLLDQNLHYHWQKKEAGDEKISSEFMEMDFRLKGDDVWFYGVRFEPEEAYARRWNENEWSFPPVGQYGIVKHGYLWLKGLK